MKYARNNQVKITGSHFANGQEIEGGSLYIGQTGTIVDVDPIVTYPYYVRFENGEVEPFIERDLELVGAKR